jgi:hypothetical protein
MELVVVALGLDLHGQVILRRRRRIICLKMSEILTEKE